MHKKIFFILISFFGISLASAEDYYPKINRFDISLTLYESACTHDFISEDSEVLAFCLDNTRTYGVDINSRVGIDKFGANSFLARHFYINLDGYTLGNLTKIEGSKIGIIRSGFDFNAGFMLPLTAAKGYNPLLLSKYSEPVILSAFFEWGLGYMVGVNDYYIENFTRSKFHVLNPSLGIGLNMWFKYLPELEWELGYKLLAGWRHSLYTKIQYDFLKLSATSSLGASVLVDGLWGSTSIGLGFKF